MTADGIYPKAVRRPRIFSNCHWAFSATCRPICEPPWKTSGYARKSSRTMAFQSRSARSHDSKIKRRSLLPASTEGFRAIADGSCGSRKKTCAKPRALRFCRNIRPTAARALNRSWTSCPALSKRQLTRDSFSRRKSCPGCSLQPMDTRRISASFIRRQVATRQLRSMTSFPPIL